MKHERIIRRYRGWIDGSLGTEERRETEQHIGECDECRAYFEKMTRLLEETDPALLPLLSPDPFLPARIRAMAESGKTRPETLATARRAGFDWIGRRRIAWARLSLAGAALLLAVTAGVFLGRGLSANARYDQENDLAEAYYEAFAPTDIAGGWADVMNQTNSNGTEEGSR
jgi:anti-sigma factor RsiW